MADSDKLWFELGVRDEVTSTLEKILGKANELQQAMTISMKGKGSQNFKEAYENAVQLEGVLLSVNRAVRNIDNAMEKMSGVGKDVSGLEDMRRKVVEVKEVFDNLFKQIQDNPLALKQGGLVDALVKKENVDLMLQQVKAITGEEIKSAGDIAKVRLAAEKDLMDFRSRLIDEEKRANREIADERLRDEKRIKEAALAGDVARMKQYDELRKQADESVRRSREAVAQQNYDDKVAKHEQELLRLREAIIRRYEEESAAAARNTVRQAANNQARQQSVQRTREQAEALVRNRRELLAMQQQELRGLLSQGKEVLGAEQYEQLRNALRSVRAEMRNLDDVMSNLGRYSIRDLFNIGRNSQSFVPLISNANRYIEESNRKKLESVQADRQLISSQQGLVASFDKVVEAGKRHNALFEQVKAQLASTVSLYAMQGLLKSVIEVGGEFEVQHIALKSILGDIEQANSMFSEIKQLAVVSPFNFSQLIAYSKQVAAFGIPYEEMYDTTKRLADLSAGLGVDMGRLILAYGQVRSAAVLRGQELRQFTEAGIPMVQALADEFTKLNGRVTTTGDVFELISKRAVPFEMVKKVLWDMTNEGGRFYNMQFTLSDTLAGKWSNLEDAWQIMLSEFAKGESLGGRALKTFVQGLTDIIEAMDKLGPMIGGFAMLRLGRYAQSGVSSLLGNELEKNIIKSQQLHAIELKRRYLNMEITQEQYNQGMALNKNRQNFYMMLAMEGRLKESQIARAIQQKKINVERLKERVESKELTMREAAQLRLWRMKYAQASIFNIKLKEIGLSLKTMMGPFGWISLAIDGIVMAMTSWYLNSERAADKMNEAVGSFSNSARDRQREIQESIEGYNSKSPTNDDEYRNAISAMKEQLKQYDANYASIMREADSIESLKGKYELLKQELEYVGESYRLAGENKGQFETLYGNTEKMSDAAKSWATSNDYLNRSLGVLAAEGSSEVEKAIDKLSEKLPKIKDLLTDIEGNRRKTGDILRDIADTLSNDEINMLRIALQGKYSAGGHASWDAYVSVFEQLDKEDKKKFEDYLKNAQKRTLEYDRNISSEIEKIVSATYTQVAAELGEKTEHLKQRVEQSGNNLDQKTKTMLRNYFTQQMSAITDGNQSLMRWVDAQRWTLYFHYDIVTDYTEKTGGLQGIAAAAWSRINPQGGAPLLNNPSAHKGFSEKEMKDAFGTSGNDVNNAKKVLSQRLHEQENLVTALKTSKDATEDQKNEAESLLRAMENDWNSMFTDNWKNLNSKGNPKSGSKKDAGLETIKNRVDLYKKFYQELQGYEKIYGLSGALDVLKKDGEFEGVFAWRKALGVTDLSNYKQTIDQLTKGFNANTEARQKFINSTKADIENKQRKDAVEGIKDYISELKRMMSVMSENYQTYKKWLDLTGNSELAARASGVTQNTTYADFLHKQMQTELAKNKKYSALSSDDVFGLSEKDALKFGKDSQIFAVWEEWRKHQQLLKKEQLDLYEEAIKNAKDYDEKIADINRDLEKQIAAIEALGGDNRLIENARQNAQDKTSELLWEKFKKENDWGRVFGDLDNLSLETIKKMVDAMKKFQKETRLSEKETRAWQKAMKDLTDKKIMLNPIKELTESIKDYNQAVKDQKSAQDAKDQADKKVNQIRGEVVTNPQAAADKQKRLNKAIDDQTKAGNKLRDAQDRTREAYNNLVKALVAIGSSLKNFGGSLSSLGSSVGGDFGNILGGLGTMFSQLGSGIEQIKNIDLNAKGFTGVINNVSAVLSIVTAMVEMNKALASILPSTESIYEKHAAEQKKINQLREAIDAYRVAVARARAEEHGWIGEDPLRGLQDAYKIHGEIASQYYNKLYEAQEAYVDSAAGIKKALVPILVAITAIVAVIAGVFSFGTGAAAVGALGATAIGALTAGTVALTGAAAVAAGAAIAAGVGYAVGQVIQAGIDAITYDNGQIDARHNMKVQTRHKTFFRSEKTQNLEEWTKENLGLDLFEESGLIDLKAAQAVLDSGATLVGETKETLEKLMELREQYDEWEKSIKDYISSSFGGLADDMTNAVWDWLSGGKDALDSFHDYASDTFKKIAQDAVKTFLKTAVLDTFEKQLEDLYKAYSMQDPNGNRVIDEQQLMLGVASIAGDMAIAFEQILPVAEALGQTLVNAFDYQGYDIVNGSGGGTSASSSIKSITEGTADLLASYINAIRADVSVNRAMIATYYPQFLDAISQNNVIANAQLEQMRAVVQNTKRNAEFVEMIYNILHGVAPDGVKIQIK